MKKIFLLLCLLILPCVAYAAGKISYNNSLNYINNYINNFNNHDKYLLATNKFSFKVSTFGASLSFEPKIFLKKFIF